MTSLAVMALYDGEAEISADQINALITATGNSVEPYWPSLFSSLLTPTLTEVIFTRGGSGAGDTSGGEGPTTSGGDCKDDAPIEEEEPKEEIVEAIDEGLDMFEGDY